MAAVLAKHDSSVQTDLAEVPPNLNAENAALRTENDQLKQLIMDKDAHVLSLLAANDVAKAKADRVRKLPDVPSSSGKYRLPPKCLVQALTVTIAVPNAMTSKATAKISRSKA